MPVGRTIDLTVVCPHVPQKYIERAKKDGVWVEWGSYPIYGVYVVVEVEGRYHVIDAVWDWSTMSGDCEMYWGFETPQEAVKYIEHLAGFRVPRKELLELLRLLASQD